MKKSLKAARVVIRPLRPADVEACAEIVGRDPLWHRYGTTVARARRAFRRAVRVRRSGGERGRAADELAVAHQRKRVLGFIWFRREGTFHHSGYVRWIAVSPQARTRGVGRRLMRYAEERIFGRGPNVFLLVSAFNRGAQVFYKRLGYGQVGAIPDYLVPGITERLYRKTRGPIRTQRRREQ
ncbi:MAG: GNAT family N-acetyltransferase [Candidatus Methylomirabilaceae bacterium]